MEKTNVLVIEDHHLMVEGYKSMLAQSNTPADIKFATDCETACKLLDQTRNRLTFEIVFLDWSLPPYEIKGISNGGDLVPWIREHSPECKLIILTSHTEAFILYEIMHGSRPEALLSKIDFAPSDYPSIIRRIIDGEILSSQTVSEQIKQITTKESYLDNYNRQIITLLSKGIKTKSLPQYLPLSMSAIDKRKAQIRDYFLLGKGNDEDIIQAARRKGLI